MSAISAFRSICPISLPVRPSTVSPIDLHNPSKTEGVNMGRFILAIKPNSWVLLYIPHNIMRSIAKIQNLKSD